MATFRINSVVVETEFNKEHNIWYARVYDRKNCYFKARRLRQGAYEFFNGIIANVDYLGKNPDKDIIDDAVIAFEAPCQLTNLGVIACG